MIEQSNGDKASWSAWLLAITAAGISLLPLVLWLDAPVHRPQDEGLLLVYPELILSGMLPHRDFLATYPPGNFFLLAGVYELFGASVTVERLVGLIYRGALVFGVFSLAARRSPLVAAVCGMSTAILLVPLRLEAFNWVGGLAALTWATVALMRGRMIWAGLLVGVAISFRLDLTPAAIATTFVILRTQPEPHEGANRSLGWTLLAVVALFVCSIGVFSPQNMLNDLILDPVFYTGQARRLGVESLGTNSVRLLVLLGLATAAALCVPWSERHEARTERTDGLAVAALSLCLLPQAFQRLDADHLLYAVALIGGILPASLDRLLAGRFRRAPILALSTGLIFSTAGAPIASLSASLSAGWWTPAARAQIHRNDRSLPARSEHELAGFAKLGALLDHEATPGQRLFIGPLDLSQTNYSDLHLYSLFPDLIPASYYIEMNPNSANRLGTRLTQDLERSDWLLLSSEWNLPGQWEAAEAGDSRPNAVVRQRFHEVGRFGAWHLYRHHRHRSL
jgi:hypothetical protein